MRTDNSKKQAHKERKERVDEKRRLADLAARMSAKKLQRMKKVRAAVPLSLPRFPSPREGRTLTPALASPASQRLGRSKAING